MRVIPAIDLMDGKCVRLVKGRKEDKIVYENTPLEIAERYWKSGARIIHVVDLDGAFTGEMKNIEIIKELASRFPIQVGGGIRSEKKVKELLSFGVKKVIVSTLLLKDLDLASQLKKRYFGKLIGSFDFKEGKLSYSGWTEQSELGFEEVAEGLYEIVVTDTSRDGTFGGPNVKLLKSLRSKFSGKIIAAGGMGSVEDLIKVEGAGVDGVIVGRALLDNKIPLANIFKFDYVQVDCYAL